ncbi:nuclear receptor coactivator 5 isoform X1 [Silurus asotus]|uniref:Nuclear receptor coactivator 5 isoform X1 n=1 Tax=Silurus asotus TaxID=30991 RepID=A0AAD5FJQ8_SILAS|nr:nuclear receptor coactivator 5 isoform X1 [Silurus asotus]
MSHRRSRSGSPPSYGTNSNDPRDLERRIFVGNLPTAHMAKKDMEELFRPYGKIQALSLFRGYGFVQFEKPEDAEAAKAGHNGRLYRGYKLDVNMAAERRQKPRSSPPRRPAGYGESREPRPRSRSPMHSRNSRESRDGRDTREHSREPRSGPPRDHDERYRGSDARDKDSRDAPHRNDSYDRFYRGEYEPYRKKDDPYTERYRENWSARREPEEERMRPEERRRNELYHQYYEELQRRYDAERPVDCSVIVVNKQQKEYAEMVGRKVRDQGMVVDLIFLNTEVSLTQALEDVSRARTPFAIIITQQHEVHRSCTVNILFGTPQEHRNMPMQDALVLVAHNYGTFKIENRTKERDEISRKAAKMADEVLMREHDRQGHPVSVLTSITLLSEGRFLTPQELSLLINYLQDKRDRLVRGNSDAHLVSHQSSAAVTHETPQSTQALAPVSHQTHPSAHSMHSTHLPAASSNTTSQQQELQAKILSLFNSGSSSSASQTQAAMSQTQGYGSTQGSSLSTSNLSNLGMSAHDSQDMSPLMGIRPPANSVGAPQGLQRAGTNINFDNPSVQKALDTLIQSGPAINQLVNSANLTARSGQVVGQGMSQGYSQGMGQGINQGIGQGVNQGMGQGINQGVGQGKNQGMGQGMSQGMGQGINQGVGQGMGQGSHYQRHF